MRSLTPIFDPLMRSLTPIFARFPPIYAEFWVHWRFTSRSFQLAENTESSKTVAHAASSSFKAKEHLYEAEYLGSGTFRIIKPKRKSAKRRQSALKGTTRGARK